MGSASARGSGHRKVAALGNWKETGTVGGALTVERIANLT